MITPTNTRSSPNTPTCRSTCRTRQRHSRTEPYLIGILSPIWLGASVLRRYPLKGKFNETRMLEALGEAKARFEPSLTSILAPALPADLQGSRRHDRRILRLDLLPLRIPKRRATCWRVPAASVRKIGEFGRDTSGWSKSLSARMSLETQPASSSIGCPNTPNARRRSSSMRAPGAVTWSRSMSRNSARGSMPFYMFNFRSHKYQVPGASDYCWHTSSRRQRHKGSYISI